MRVGATGVTLGREPELFWNRSDELFSIDLDVLECGDLHDIDAVIVTWPPRPFASDGLDHDASGRVLLTDLANSGVQRLDPATGRYEPLATDPAISWPDGVNTAPDGSAYARSSRIHRSAMFADTDIGPPPFGILHLRPDHAAPSTRHPRR